MSLSVGQLLRQGALQHARRTAICDLGEAGEERRELDYAALDERARAVAAELQGYGVGRGDAVALCAHNSLELVAAWFGIVYAGAAVVPIPILSAAPELRYRLQHAGCRLLVHDRARTELAREATSSSALALPCLRVEDLFQARARPLTYPVDTAPEDIALILYTSGTTGQAKGAAISHAALAMHTTVIGHFALRLTESDRVLCVLPLTHSYGCRMGLLASCFAGACAVVMPRFDAARSFAVLADEAVTWFPAVPTMYAAWAGLAETQRCRVPAALRWCLSAGAPLPDELVRRAEACLGVELRQGYGLTEATFATINAPPDARIIGSVGQPVWGIELRIVDAEGRDVPRGETGEVFIRGHNTMSRYLHDDGATREIFRDGFVASGDIGRLDEAGRLTIVDRIKDLIIRGGNNVYPSEVEDVLAAHPAVEQVAVVGRPDPYYGEEVVAVVLPRAGTHPTIDGLLELARARLSRTKLPREVVFVEALPLGPSGKVLKRELRRALIEGKLSASGGLSGDSAPAALSKEQVR